MAKVEAVLFWRVCMFTLVFVVVVILAINGGYLRLTIQGFDGAPWVMVGGDEDNITTGRDSPRHDAADQRGSGLWRREEQELSLGNHPLRREGGGRVPPIGVVPPVSSSSDLSLSSPSVAAADFSKTAKVSAATHTAATTTTTAAAAETSKTAKPSGLTTLSAPSARKPVKSAPEAIGKPRVAEPGAVAATPQQHNISRNIHNRERTIKKASGFEKTIPPYAAYKAVFQNLSLTAHEIFGQPRYLINNDICDNKTSIFVYIQTAAHHFAERSLLRQTWCNSSLFMGMKVGFFVGRTTNDIQQGLLEENSLHHDIIQGDFRDAYTNLTYKVVVALNWINSNCRQAQWLIKADDDVIMDTFAFFQHVLPLYGHHNRTLIGLCKDSYPLSVERLDAFCTTKTCVPFDYFPGKKCYQPYCAGPLTFVTMDLIADLYKATFKVHYFWIEDVYFSRMLLQETTNHIVFFLPGQSLADYAWCGHATEKREKPVFACRPHSRAGYLTLWQEATEYYLSKKSYRNYLRVFPRRTFSKSDPHPEKC